MVPSAERCHCQVKEALAGVHAPAVEVSVWPCMAVPVMLGGVWLDGGCAGVVAV